MTKKATTSPADIFCVGEGEGTCDDALCCKADTTKCGGVTLSCPAKKFSPTKSVSIGSGNANTVCCTQNKATCADYTCSAANGRKLKANPAGTLCAGGADRCDDATCCINDPDKCAGIGGVTCPSHRWQNPDLKGVSATAGSKNTVCCDDKALCATVSCDVGMETKQQVCTKGSNKQECTNCDCCESNPGLCGSISPVTCNSTNHFWDSGKTNDVYTDPAVSCCSPKGNCGGFSCEAWKTKKTDAAKKFCNGGTGGSCDSTQCCDMDTTKCGGVTLSCPEKKFSPSKSVSIGSGDANTACCTQNKKTCADYPCSEPNAMKKKATPAEIICVGEGEGTCNEALCCEADTTKCGGVALSCPPTKFSPTKSVSIGSGNANTVCCTQNKATCADYPCDAGMGRKLKASPEGTLCAGGAGSCDDARCCINDPDKCAGIGGVTCKAPSYYDAALTAGISATATTKNYVCCSLSETCEDALPGPPGLTILQKCPASASVSSGEGAAVFSGTVNSGFRLAPKGFVTSCLMATLAYLK